MRCRIQLRVRGSRGDTGTAEGTAPAPGHSSFPVRGHGAPGGRCQPISSLWPPPSSPRWLPNLPGPGSGSITAGLRGATSAGRHGRKPAPRWRRALPGHRGSGDPTAAAPARQSAGEPCCRAGTGRGGRHRDTVPPPNALERGPSLLQEQGPCPAAPSLRVGVPVPAAPAPPPVPPFPSSSSSSSSSSGVNPLPSPW